ncbi:HAD family hydrolase [Defluviimonas sp. 20V17]|uniref:Haloacid dehalogenase n=1 Tax=Allgaiera indica TaxID=765699 RepID=A0AAN4UTE9_9RHOB|nr:HAD family hydrolase [Allgaiera indica]KDB05626.1 HAD family hydrolase [Defluviimonas sp. 20V17]GHE04373.1 haloacid dehalogenase [Allgaiera indica]SDX40716.1 haloacid dehalogenase superfamily, subfamily IA, variant 3 with third motif having DD or ED [Allgaiera indica]
MTAGTETAAIDLVIFDCDGVLIDSEVISARMLIAELARHGVAIDMGYVARHFLGRSYPVVLQNVRETFGIDLPRNFEADYRARLLSAFETGLQVMPGVAEVIDRLRVPYCAATSSSPERAARSLELTGLTARFAGRLFTASEVAHGKPAPDLFEHAAAKMGARPARCLVIEDSLTGLRAGRAAQMRLCWFAGGSHIAGAVLPPEAPRPDVTLAGFADFFVQFPDLQRKETVP